jgi:two-component system probable response regulator PhcQ
VLQKQTLATRIGLIRTLSATLIGPERFQPVETYLAAAVLADVQSSEPDWLLLDYSDLVAAESSRGGTFGNMVASKLAELRNRRAGSSAGDVVAAMAETLEEVGIRVRREADALVWDELPALAEFLGEPANQTVSTRHAVWLASLLWLDANDFALEPVREGDSVAFRPTQYRTEFPADRLAAWIEQF